MKKVLSIISLICFALLLPRRVLAQESYQFFYGDGCPHCAKVEEYFQTSGILNKVDVEFYEIYADRDNAVMFNDLLDQMGVPLNSRGVPTLIAGDQVIVGDTPIISFFQDMYGDVSSGLEPVDSDYEFGGDGLPDTPEVKKESQNLTIFSVIAASLVDAINPCAFAVLILLVSTVLASGNSKRALKSGFAFAASIFISYLMMGLGIYKALSFGGLSQIFFRVVGWLAVIVGLLNLKDYFWYGKGFLMEVPLSWRPKMKSLLKSVTSPLGAFSVGFVVSLFLLPCTSGPYIVILGMLAKKTNLAQAISYLVLYNLIFVSPMVMITYAVYKGFDPSKAEEIRQKRLRTLHLIAGILMIAIGVVVLAGWI